MILLELELGRVLDGDDPLAVRNERREHVQQRRLPRPGATTDDDVEPGPHGARVAPRESAEDRSRGPPGLRP